MLTAAAAAAAIVYLAIKIVKYKKSISIYLSELSRIETRQIRYLNDITDLIREIMVTTAISGENHALLAKRLQKNFTVQHSNVESLIRNLPSLADTTCCGLITHLRINFPLLTENDILFISMTALKFDQSCIDYAFGYYNARTYYNKRYDIRKKIDIPENVNLEDYISSTVRGLSLVRETAFRTAISKRTMSPLLGFRPNDKQ